jgi:hypothetical protein
MSTRTQAVLAVAALILPAPRRSSCATTPTTLIWTIPTIAAEAAPHVYRFSFPSFF